MAVSVVAEKECLLGPGAFSKTLQPGETLFLEGDTPNAVYQVEDGFVKLTWVSPNGRETISELLLPGDVFDLPSCLDGRPYPFTCKAPSNSEAKVWVLSRSSLQEDPQLAWRCQGRLVQQLRRQRTLPVAAPCDRVEVRMSRALFWLADVLGKRVDQRVTFPLWLTRQELGEWVGTTTETVIRLCSDWKRRGLVEFGSGWLTMSSPKELLGLCDAA